MIRAFIAFFFNNQYITLCGSRFWDFMSEIFKILKTSGTIFSQSEYEITNQRPWRRESSYGVVLVKIRNYKRLTVTRWLQWRQWRNLIGSFWMWQMSVHPITLQVLFQRSSPIWTLSMGCFPTWKCLSLYILLIFKIYNLLRRFSRHSKHEF